MRISDWSSDVCSSDLNGDPNSYAFGLVIGTHRGLKTVSHSGGWAAFSTFVLHFPGEAFSVVVLMNHGSLSPGKTAYSIADLYLSAAMDARKPAGTEIRPDNHTPLEVPAAVLNRYKSTYLLGPAWYITTPRKCNRLIHQATPES